jgi:hypothetical protein
MDSKQDIKNDDRDENREYIERLKSRIETLEILIKTPRSKT